MAPGTHACIGWWVANVEPLDRRDRFILFLAGVLPDLDGLPLFWSNELYLTYHHVLCHNLIGCVIWTAVAAAACRRRLVCATLAALSWHLHLACDYFGSGGSDGSVWVLPYLYPAVGGWTGGGEFVGPEWYWNPWQWPLKSWQNFAASALGAAGWVYIAVRLDRTFFEFISPWFDGEMCKMLRRWFGGHVSPTWGVTEGRWIRRTFLAGSVVAVVACVLAASQAVPGGVRH